MAAGDQQPWAVRVKDWAGRAIAASRTRKHAPGRTGLGHDADRDAVLQRPRRAGPYRRLRAIPSAKSLRTTRSATSPPASACPRWSSNGTWTASQIVRPVQTSGIHRPGDRYLLRSGRLSLVAEDRPHFYVQTFGRRICQRAGQLAVLAGPGQRVPVDAVPLGKDPACAAKSAPGSRSPPRTGARRSAGMYGGGDRPRERPPLRSCPMLPDGLAYHRRDNLPGQNRAQIRPPGPSAKITQGARPCDTGTHHAT